MKKKPDHVTPWKEQYTIVRPILLAVIPLLFFKPNWKTHLKNFIDGLDAAIK